MRRGNAADRGTKTSGIFSACRFCAAAAAGAIVIASTASAAAADAGTYHAASPPPGPAELNWSRKPVLFSHQTHLNAPALRSRARAAELYPRRSGGEEANSPSSADSEVCVSCHHPVNGVTRHLTCATQDCHDNFNPRDKSARSYYLATHAAPKVIFYSCVACHTEQAGNDAAAVKRMAACEDSVCHR
jgi:hypothetical protein